MKHSEIKFTFSNLPVSLNLPRFIWTPARLTYSAKVVINNIRPAEFALMFRLDSDLDVQIAEQIANMLTNAGALVNDADPSAEPILPGFAPELFSGDSEDSLSVLFLSATRVGRYFILQINNLHYMSRFCLCWFLMENTLSPDVFELKIAQVRKIASESPYLTRKSSAELEDAPAFFYYLFAAFRGQFIGCFINEYFFPYADFESTLESFRAQRGRDVTSRPPFVLRTDNLSSCNFSEQDLKDFARTSFILNPPATDDFYYEIKQIFLELVCNLHG